MSQVKKRNAVSVSLPTETYERVKRHLDEFGNALGYSPKAISRYVQAAVLEKVARDGQEMERFRAMRRREDHD